jgi:hypothetical protein
VLDEQGVFTMAAEASSDALRNDESVWVRDVDYVRAWAKARDAAEDLNGVLDALGLRRAGLRATAHTDGEGNGVVRLHGTPEEIRAVVEVLRRARAGT